MALLPLSLSLSLFLYLLVFLGTDLPNGNENEANTLRSQVRYMLVPSSEKTRMSNH